MATQKYNYWITPRYNDYTRIYIVRYPHGINRYSGQDEYLTHNGIWIPRSPPETFFNSVRWALSVFCKIEGNKKINKDDLQRIGL